jgi:hypothetical protein
MSGTLLPAEMSCQTCGKLRKGNIHHPDGRVEKDVTVCLDLQCDPGFATGWRPGEMEMVV